MGAEMSNDPTVLAVLASLSLLVFAVQTWRMRPRDPKGPDAPSETEWRNRWHR